MRRNIRTKSGTERGRVGRKEGRKPTLGEIKAKTKTGSSLLHCQGGFRQKKAVHVRVGGFRGCLEGGRRGRIFLTSTEKKDKPKRVKRKRKGYLKKTN